MLVRKLINNFFIKKILHRSIKKCDKKMAYYFDFRVIFLIHFLSETYFCLHEKCIHCFISLVRYSEKLLI